MSGYQLVDKAVGEREDFLVTDRNRKDLIFRERIFFVTCQREKADGSEKPLDSKLLQELIVKVFRFLKIFSNFLGGFFFWGGGLFCFVFTLET